MVADDHELIRATSVPVMRPVTVQIGRTLSSMRDAHVDPQRRRRRRGR